jgi:ATP-binding cassette subfamily B protein
MAMGWMISILQRGRAAMFRLEHIFAAESEIVAPAPNGEAPIARGDIEIEDVSFAYPTARKAKTAVLSGVTLRIRAGETVALVGRTGAGKSSLAQLLPRLFDPDRGAIRIDGRDVKTMSLATLRRALGVVPQDPFLFSSTIRENVAFGLGGNGETDARVEWAAEVAALGDDLAALPHGLETPVGERGITLSGGQKQRVTLARALAIEPKVLLLDDALSSVDAETEKRILERLREACPDRTCLLISHRASTLKAADRIVVLDDGRIVESGTHEELLRRSGVYAEIFREDALADELEAL